MWIIVDCPKCGKKFIKRAFWRTVKCPYCGAKKRLTGEYRVYRTVREARLALKNM